MELQQMNWNQLGPSHEKTRPINWIYIYMWSNRHPIAMESNIQANGNLSTGFLHSINPINDRPWNPRFKHIKTRNTTVKPSLKSPIDRMAKTPWKSRESRPCPANISSWMPWGPWIWRAPQLGTTGSETWENHVFVLMEKLTGFDDMLLGYGI